MMSAAETVDSLENALDPTQEEWIVIGIIIAWKQERHHYYKYIKYSLLNSLNTWRQVCQYFLVFAWYKYSG